MNPLLSYWSILVFFGIFILMKKYCRSSQKRSRERLVWRSTLQSSGFKALKLLLYLVFLYAIFNIRISESSFIWLIYSHIFRGFHFSEKISFKFAKTIAGELDFPSHSSRFPSFVTSVVFVLSLCGFYH